MGDFRFPYDIAATLAPWRDKLGDEFDSVVALLADRDRALEDAVGAGAHTHAGTGEDSVVVWQGTTTPAVASAEDSVAIGDGAEATGDGEAVAIGFLTEASGEYSTALGGAAIASAQFATAVGDAATASASMSTALGSTAIAEAANSLALGAAAFAEHEKSTAIGYSASTSGTQQIHLGGHGSAVSRTIMGAPASAIADANLGNSQLSFYLNQALNTLIVKVKYSDGTVKTGTIALV